MTRVGFVVAALIVACSCAAPAPATRDQIMTAQELMRVLETRLWRSGSQPVDMAISGQRITFTFLEPVRDYQYEALAISTCDEISKHLVKTSAASELAFGPAQIDEMPVGASDPKREWLFRPGPACELPQGSWTMFLRHRTMLVEDGRVKAVPDPNRPLRPMTLEELAQLK